MTEDVFNVPGGLTIRDLRRDRTLASYAIGDSALFIRGEEHLYRIQSRTTSP